jgi:hypothetical protein
MLGPLVVVGTRCTAPWVALLVLHPRSGGAGGGRGANMSGERMVPRLAPAGGIVGRLLDLADMVRRLAPPGHRDPERFHIEKSELAAELRRVAHDAQRRPLD